jgi:hypothetical protein
MQVLIVTSYTSEKSLRYDRGLTPKEVLGFLGEMRSDGHSQSSISGSAATGKDFHSQP